MHLPKDNPYSIPAIQNSNIKLYSGSVDFLFTSQLKVHISELQVRILAASFPLYMRHWHLIPSIIFPA